MHPCRTPGLMVLAAWLLAASSVTAEEPSPGNQDSLTPVGCVGCNSGLLPPLAAPPFPDAMPGLGAGPADPGDLPCNCGGGLPCVPGRKPCYPCHADSIAGRFLCGVYECICCPDPCYEPKWTPLADAAFYTAAVRPVVQTRFRYDGYQAIVLPDRSEYFWARADGMGKGPRPPAGGFPGEPRVNANDLKLITEGGTGTISLIVETTYRSIDPVQAPHAAGFADMAIGTKTLLFDCELLQISTLFMTYLPTGNFTKGLGVGHTSLEPSLLVGVKLSPTTYLQTQLSEWIPLGGDPSYAGAILHYHLSLNQELLRILPDVPLIATGEFIGYSFQDGAYTDPILGPNQKSSGYTYATLGGGLRLFVCDRIDFGFAGAFALTQQHFARETYTVEFRVRF